MNRLTVVMREHPVLHSTCCPDECGTALAALIVYSCGESLLLRDNLLHDLDVRLPRVLSLEQSFDIWSDSCSLRDLPPVGNRKCLIDCQEDWEKAGERIHKLFQDSLRRKA